MRDLIAKIDPSLWSNISATAFSVAFCVLVCWVYWPARKSRYQDYSRLPIDGD